MAFAHSRRHKALGRAVRETRARRGLSQEQLGFLAGLHRNYVGAIERGEINPTLRVLYKLEDGLQMPMWELMKLADERHDEVRHQAGVIVETRRDQNGAPPTTVPHG